MPLSTEVPRRAPRGPVGPQLHFAIYGRGILRGVPALYHDAMKITPTPHGHRRMHERRVTVADIRYVLNGRPQMHFSPNKRVHTGRALDGRRLEVMYTEAKAGEVRIVSVAAS
jgi:hypothetical protein